MNKQPKLVNRHAGLDTKVNHSKKVIHEATSKEYLLDDIRCTGEIVDLDSLCPDPMNARLHGERNLDAIKDSLMSFGQKSPIVVRQQGRVIAAGNGRCRAAKELGWKKIACDVQEMTDEEFHAFALADNRTAELASWDFVIMAKIEKLLQETSEPMVGWSDDEIEVFRMAWTPPDVVEEQKKEKTTKLVFTLTVEDKKLLDEAITLYKQFTPTTAEDGDMQAILCICQEWVAIVKGGEGTTDA